MKIMAITGYKMAFKSVNVGEVFQGIYGNVYMKITDLVTVTDDGVHICWNAINLETGDPVAYDDRNEVYLKSEAELKLN